MNEISNMNLGFLGLFQSPVAASSAGLNGLLPKSDLEQGDFHNLLDLVSDVELADSLDLGSQEDASKNLELLAKNESSAILVAANTAQLVLDVPRFEQSVGPALNLPQPETQSKIEVVTEQLSRQAFALESVNLKQGPTMQDNESLRVWSQALASEELKTVEISSVSVPNSTPLVSAEKLSQNVKGEIFAQAIPLQRSEKAQLQKPVVDSLRISGPAVATVETKKQESQIGKTFSEVSVEPMPTKVTEKKITVNADSKPQNESKSQSGSSFLLEKSHSDKSLAKDASDKPLINPESHNLKPALNNAATLGLPEDTRISPQSIDFVADKVQALREQGGGRIRLEMDTKELGIVELKVGIRGSKVEIQMIAQNPEAQKALDASKDTLIQQIESKHSFKADVVESTAHLWSSRQSSGSLASHVDSAKRAASTSQALLETRSVPMASNTMSAQEMHDTVRENSNMSSMRQGAAERTLSSDLGMNMSMSDQRSGSESSSNEGQSFSRERSQANQNQHSREDSREKALNSWEQSFENRKSA